MTDRLGTGTPAGNGSTLTRELAHELRDALSPLAPAADLARLRGFDAEASRLLVEKVERGLQRTLAILDAFVLAEQCEAGALQLAPCAVAWADILQAALEALAEHEAGRCTFTPAEGQRVVCADLAWSAQVLRALLQHMVTIAPPGSTIEVRPVVRDDELQIRLRSHRDPRTMPGEEWFATYSGGGGRMALRTARRIMALQGGALDLVRNDEVECELLMRFRADTSPPVAERRTTPPPPPGASPSALRPRTGHRILIVDDSVEVRRAYREALVARGYTVTEAADAEQALSAIAGDPPDVALIDIHLPRMNGYQLMQLIRGRGLSHASIYFVMLSGMALDAVTRELARKAGFDDCLDKMAGPLALRDLIASAPVAHMLPLDSRRTRGRGDR